MPEDLAVPFFVNFSREHPGKFPSRVAQKDSPEQNIEPVVTGIEIQAIFFDLWRHDHPDADLEPVPADLVMASGSGLDPHITLKNARYQLDRITGKWASDQQRDPLLIRQEIGTLLEQSAFAPLGGLAGEKLVNVVQINLALRDRYSPGTKPIRQP